MRILIVEDETAAYENLMDLIMELDPEAEILANTESVSQTVRWLQSHPKPDLIFMDIHLSDGSAFSIFEHVEVESPIVFTTAYDQYAIDAFKVNSIDYLLKPIKPEELRRALDKFSRLGNRDIIDYLSQLGQLAAPANYKERLLIPYKDKFMLIETKDIACFYATDKVSLLYLNDGSSYSYRKSLDQIMQTLNPARFIRANKQFIVSRDSIKELTIWFDSRLLVNMKIELPERIYISKNRVSEFKNWIVG